MLCHGANVDSQDFKGCTPLFYAASNSSLEILIELLDSGNANVQHVLKDAMTTAFSKAHNYEAVMILTKYGAETNRNPNDMKRLMQQHNASSSKAILSQCISEVNEELLVLDFGHFKHIPEKNNEMDLHLLVQDNGKSELLLHPILQVFLDWKWNQVKKFFWFNLLLDIVFVVLLTFSADHFLSMTFCGTCDDYMDRGWSMEIDNNNARGTIHCFNENGSENCTDLEKCARFTEDGTNKLIQSYDTWGNLGIKCHRNSLRYIWLQRSVNTKLATYGRIGK